MVLGHAFFVLRHLRTLTTDSKSRPWSYLPHSARIGAGAGAIVGAATGGCSTAAKNSFLGCFLTPTRPQGAAIGGVLFGVIAVPIGYFTDFAKSTVYKAP